MFKKPTTVADILSTFTKTVADLRTLAEARTKDGVKAYDDAHDLRKKGDADLEEANKALAAASKIEALIV